MSVDVSAEHSDALAFRSRYARRRLEQPSPLDFATFRSWLTELDAESRYDLIVVSTEASLLPFRQFDESDALRVKAILPSNRALDIALDKHRTWAHALEVGIRVPETVLVTGPGSVPPPPAQGYPVVLKPIRSKVDLNGSLTYIEPRVVRTEEDRLLAFEEWLPVAAVQQQQYVQGTGIGVELLYDRGRAVLHFLHERIHEWPLTGGASTYRKSLRPDAPALAAAARLLGSLAWHGVAMVEFKRAPDGTLYLMEINPRLWGSLALALDAGVDFPLALARIACGQPLPTHTARYRLYYTRCLPGDLQWMWANLRADSSDPLLMSRPRVGSLVEYLRPLIGKESWDHFDWRDLGITRTMLYRLLRYLAGYARSALHRRYLRAVLPRSHRRCLARFRQSTRPVRRILFVCHGNICRSAFATAYGRARLSRLSFNSAGFHPIEGRVTPAKVKAAASSLGVDLTAHRAARINGAVVEEADLILLMDTRNYQSFVTQFSEAVQRTTMLGLFAPRPCVEIPDPVSSSEADAREILSSLRDAVDGLTSWLTANEKPQLRVDATPRSDVEPAATTGPQPGMPHRR